MKKLITMALLVAMLLSCFAGCAMQKGEIAVAGEANVQEVGDETAAPGILDDLRTNVEKAKTNSFATDEVDTWDGVSTSPEWRDRAVLGEDGKTRTTINSAAELVDFRAQMKTEATFFAGWEITLTKNIDFGGNDNTLEGISAQFAGTFNGGNHVIYNYTMSLAKNCGFFGNIQHSDVDGDGVYYTASVQNVAFVNAICNVTGTTTAGSVAGNVKGTSNIDNVYSNATVNGASATKVGGLFGAVTGSPYTKNITNCEFGGKINSTNTGSVYVGGIAGCVNGGVVTFSYCAVAEDAEINCVGSYVGGITAYGNTKEELKISHCVNNAELKGVNGVGGLVAFYKQKSATVAHVIEYSTNNGKITATGNNIGGLVGEYGQINELSVIGCTNNGAVSGVNNVGGVLGGVIDGVTSPISIQGSVNNGAITGTAKVGGVIGNAQGEIDIAVTNCKNNGTLTGDSDVYDIADTTIAAVSTIVMAGYQVTAVGEDNKYDIRFVAAFDDAQAQAAGFVVSVYYKDADGKKAKVENVTVYAKTVYTSVKGTNADGEVETYAATNFGGKYLYTLVIENIEDVYTVADGTLEILVTPFVAENEETAINGSQVQYGKIVIEEPAA